MVLFWLYNFLDGVFVGHLINDQVLAAVGIAFALIQIGQAIDSLIDTSVRTGISILIDAENTQKLGKCLCTVNYLRILYL